MKKLFSLPNEPSNLQIDHFRTRLKTRLFVITIFIIQLVERIYFNYGYGSVSKNAKDLFALSLPFIIGEILIILLECLLYKKIGSRILKYSTYIDFVFLLCFTAEWILTWYAALSKYKGTAADCIGISSLIAFSSFAWRTLIQNLIIQHWFFKSLAPMAIYGIMMGFVVSLQPSMKDFNLTRGITNAVFTMMIFYVESKISYKLLLVNLKQDKWMHVNQFILNNIPEKIAILDLNGEVKYTTDYFKAYLQRWHYAQNIEKFFCEVQNLQRQYELDSFNLPIFDNHAFDRSSSTISRRNDSEIEKTTFEKIPSLEILIKQFRALVQNNQIQQKSFLSFSGTLKPQDSTERSIELKISYIHQDSHPYLIIILKDTTQRNLLITLESTNKYKDQLLASVSHELRTPLNGNISLIEAALRDPTISDPIKEKFLVPALKSGQFLSHLINDILDTAQIRAQKLRLAFKLGNLRETLTNSSQLLQLQAKKKNIKLEIDLDPDLPAEICTDHSRLSQIVLNLLNNSIKFTKQGFVKLIAVPVPNSNCIKISVEDSGVGMDQQDIKKLFIDYTHIDREDMVQINPNGVGLGLSIAYNLVKLIGPENNKGIKVSSVLDRGSTFSFLVENKQSEPLQSVPENEEISLLKSEIDDIAIEPVIDQKKFKSYSKKYSRGESSDVALITQREISECVPVLVVDDDAFNILAYESLLDSLTIKYACVDNGKTAIDTLLNKRCFGSGCKCFSVVLMDQEMPEMTGVETISEIKKLQRQDLIPEIDIIGCTAHQRKEDIDLMIDAGAKECIQKPISMTQLQNIVQKYL